MCVCNHGAYADNLADAVNQLLIIEIWHKPPGLSARHIQIDCMAMGGTDMSCGCHVVVALNPDKDCGS